ncbi:tRNA dimethylallyltransferase, mitochondrial [Babesia bigemina]|uniref:tRNA dimethylallyltransferase n=1 Tax=Babesia bigemina TaxID=5866 RepID=A0A061D9S6_BABBI|nr:tRNA dimethylallyltransferase, mitochondrial [Babesia bigemina]CDR95669.1 tRNA dimethylallyltransferase, mitochondrial [Babesia bigemina]|eukprot:XP_012767855.1 tRNA dimethylallyltransferase, mitochondrial [Babesia bigemina]
MCAVHGFRQTQLHNAPNALLHAQIDKTMDSCNVSDPVTRARKTIVVILGPTATGKTDASIEVARVLKENNIKAEVVNADSMQVYDGFDVGTAKPTQQQMERVKHHLFGYVPPTTDYNAAKYVATASQLIEQMHDNGILPILVGGTNLYIEALLWPSVIDLEGKEAECNNDPYQGIPVHAATKHPLEYDNAELYDQLTALDPQRAAVLHQNDRKRVIRSLEVINLYGIKHSELIKRRLEVKQKSGPKYDALIFAMICDPTEHKKRIKERARKMLQDGIIDECKNLMSIMGALKYFRQLLNHAAYKEIIPILKQTEDNGAELDDATIQRCADALETATWQYARRQMTWIKNRFKADSGLNTILLDTTGMWNSSQTTFVL